MSADDEENDNDNRPLQRLLLRMDPHAFVWRRLSDLIGLSVRLVFVPNSLCFIHFYLSFPSKQSLFLCAYILK